MTSQLFENWLNKVNIKMKSEERSILLFVDNCTAHPDVVRSNVKLVFLPPNTTSKLQPCDAGIIQTVKTHYRKQLLRHVLFHIDKASCVSELAKKVNVLDAIVWLRSAWDRVHPSTIRKCFAKCGFVEPDAVDEGGATDLPESEQENMSLEIELESLVNAAGTTWTEYANCDQDLTTTRM
ncbi:tigger transposable element-derived protein 6-like [Corticium candelabrum]|uniref:tigger transposable element-derived protein 6-like n=1 Tax=Corticium candelabrum TaxID=121492 RepID=UPI002E26A0B8|nr:tigger transposable element-derived protein 6-like [Corticium candelabrum]